MKEILDIIILLFFVWMIAMFIIGFNRQQIEKHKNKLAENEKMKNEEKKDDETTAY
ncbi:MAG: hypothetical protein ACNI3C_10785 [Candidatus Marinarcus sp.]|uniref:hypothetical protein n=1 Tax=Candidatus Marinarcus sp. TaxID=3100987 RepID=UPI003B00E822